MAPVIGIGQDFSHIVIKVYMLQAKESQRTGSNAQTKFIQRSYGTQRQMG